MKNKMLGSTLLVAGTTIGAGMLAMPLTSAGIGFGLTVGLLATLWLFLCFSALLFVEVYQTAPQDAGIASLAEQYFGRAGRIVVTAVLLIFMYAILSAYVTGGGSLLAGILPNFGDAVLTKKMAIIVFTIILGIFIIVGTQSVDGLNRILFFTKIIAFILVLALMLPKVSMDNLMELPIDKALLISASPVFFTAFGFHGTIPSLNNYLAGNIRQLRFSIIVGTAIPLVIYIVWQLATHGVLSQTGFLTILQNEPTLNGLVNATTQITGSALIGGAVRLFSALALITSFLGVALGLFECLEDLFKRINKTANRTSLGLLTFVPPLMFALFYPDGFIAALGYAGLMFAFFAVILPIGLVWRARKSYPTLPYRVFGGNIALLITLVIGVLIVIIPFLIELGLLPTVVG